jgi:Leucine-rich repeat (LRR) protein
MMRTSQTTFFK